MNDEERAQKDLEKLDELVKKFIFFELNKKYPRVYEHSLNYKKDAEHYYKKEDYFSSFGCANYAYGILEGILLKEKGKLFHEF